MPATPPAVSSGKSATLRLPLSIINGGVLQTHAAELPRGRACPVCSQLNRAGQRGGSGSSVPRPAVCVRASSHTSSNNGKKEVSTTTTQKAMRGPWTCGASKMGRNKRREGGGKNLGPSLIGEGHTQVEGEEENFPLPPPIASPTVFRRFFLFCLRRHSLEMVQNSLKLFLISPAAPVT